MSKPGAPSDDGYLDVSSDRAVTAWENPAYNAGVKGGGGGAAMYESDDTAVHGTATSPHGATGTVSRGQDGGRRSRILMGGGVLVMCAVVAVGVVMYTNHNATKGDDSSAASNSVGSGSGTASPTTLPTTTPPPTTSTTTSQAPTTLTPTTRMSNAPTHAPTVTPSVAPTRRPTTSEPTGVGRTEAPSTAYPTTAPTARPTRPPSARPTMDPTTLRPTPAPTTRPTSASPTAPTAPPPTSSCRGTSAQSCPYPDCQWDAVNSQCGPSCGAGTATTQADCVSPCQWIRGFLDYACFAPGVVPGRPFMVHGQQRTAEACTMMEPNNNGDDMVTPGRRHHGRSDTDTTIDFSSTTTMHRGPSTCASDGGTKGTATAAEGWLADASDLHAESMEDIAVPNHTATRHLLAAHWHRMAAAEHASVASFSRHSMHLLALAAPRRLVEATHAAAMDEVRHARLAYALASHYGGTAVGPAGLDIAGAMDTATTNHNNNNNHNNNKHNKDPTDSNPHHSRQRAFVDTVLDMTVVEGCVGETMATLEARAAAQLTTDPLVSRVLNEIATDEARHARLAWDVVLWYAHHHPDRVSDIQTMVTAAVESRHGSGVSMDDRINTIDITNVQDINHVNTNGHPASARDFGVLTSTDMTVVARAAVEQVIGPMSQLLGTTEDGQRIETLLAKTTLPLAPPTAPASHMDAVERVVDACGSRTIVQ